MMTASIVIALLALLISEGSMPCAPKPPPRSRCGSV